MLARTHCIMQGSDSLAYDGVIAVSVCLLKCFCMGSYEKTISPVPKKHFIDRGFEAAHIHIHIHSYVSCSRSKAFEIANDALSLETNSLDQLLFRL